MEVDRTGADEVVVRLTYDEALVLSEFLDRWYRVGFEHAIEVVDPSESRVLDTLCAAFEPMIDEVFAADYLDILGAARHRLSRTTDSD